MQSSARSKMSGFALHCRHGSRIAGALQACSRDIARSKWIAYQSRQQRSFTGGRGYSSGHRQAAPGNFTSDSDGGRHWWQWWHARMAPHPSPSLKCCGAAWAVTEGISERCV